MPPTFYNLLSLFFCATTAYWGCASMAYIEGAAREDTLAPPVTNAKLTAGTVAARQACAEKESMVENPNSP